MAEDESRSGSTAQAGSHRDFLKTAVAAAGGLCLGRSGRIVAAVPVDGKPREITPGAPQIFVDLDAVEMLENVRQLFYPAEKHPANPVIIAEKPWERRDGGPCGAFIHDEDEKIFKCWYQGVGTLNYRTSTDGIHWQRLNPGIYDVHGTKENNVVVPSSYPNEKGPRGGHDPPGRVRLAGGGVRRRPGDDQTVRLFRLDAVTQRQGRRPRPGARRTAR